MENHFKHTCRRRSGEVRPTKVVTTGIAPFGAGSGGGPDDGHSGYNDGEYFITGSTIKLLCSPQTFASPHGDDNLLSLNSPGTGANGLIQAHASQGVRISVGPPQMPDASAKNTQGAEIAVGEEQEIRLTQGVVPGLQRLIVLDSSKITINSNLVPVNIMSTTQIKISCGPTSSITLTPAGVTIQGLLTQIN
jgi:hypothetical protein